MAETVYVITAYELNHGSPDYRGQPLDPRFVDSDRNYVYFLIDKEVPEPLEGKRTLFEKDFDPKLARAGAKHLAEWSFLLMEAQEAFCEYPFFMVSSRFYEKNLILGGDLNSEWERMFAYLRRYRWGYLPSYNRPLRWLHYDFDKQVAYGKRYGFSPFNPESFSVVEDLWGVRIPEEYPAWTDLQCNYIGFASREDLLAYVDFYRPFFEFFFDEEWEVKRDLTPYVRNTLLHYRNEKPLTYLLEFLSHLFFFARDLPFFALHYRGYYEIEERHQRLRMLEPARWSRNPAWIASWLALTRVFQPLWPHVPPALQGRVVRVRVALEDLLRRRRRRALTPTA